MFESVAKSLWSDFWNVISYLSFHMWLDNKIGCLDDKFYTLLIRLSEKKLVVLCYKKFIRFALTLNGAQRALVSVFSIMFCLPFIGPYITEIRIFTCEFFIFYLAISSLFKAIMRGRQAILCAICFFQHPSRFMYWQTFSCIKVLILEFPTKVWQGSLFAHVVLVVWHVSLLKHVFIVWVLCWSASALDCGTIYSSTIAEKIKGNTVNTARIDIDIDIFKYLVNTSHTYIFDLKNC